MNKVRGIRGAITVTENTETSILTASNLLLNEMIIKNEIIIEDICSIFFTVTNDLNKEFPAKAARKSGLSNTPLLCMTEIPVENALPKCIRILIHYNTTKNQTEIKHVYLRDAVKLRPDLTDK